MELLAEMMFTSKITDDKRLREIVAEVKSRLQASIASAGHSVASTRAMTYFSKEAAYRDSLALYELLCDLDAHFVEKKDMLAAKLTAITEKIFTKGRLTVSVTCEGDGRKLAGCELEKFLPEALCRQ